VCALLPPITRVRAHTPHPQAPRASAEPRNATKRREIAPPRCPVRRERARRERPRRDLEGGDPQERQRAARRDPCRPATSVTSPLSPSWRSVLTDDAVDQAVLQRGVRSGGGGECPPRPVTPPSGAADARRHRAARAMRGERLRTLATFVACAFAGGARVAVMGRESDGGCRKISPAARDRPHRGSRVAVLPRCRNRPRERRCSSRRPVGVCALLPPITRVRAHTPHPQAPRASAEPRNATKRREIASPRCPVRRERARRERPRRDLEGGDPQERQRAARRDPCGPAAPVTSPSSPSWRSVLTDDAVDQAVLQRGVRSGGGGECPPRPVTPPSGAADARRHRAARAMRGERLRTLATFVACAFAGGARVAVMGRESDGGCRKISPAARDRPHRGSRVAVLPRCRNRPRERRCSSRRPVGGVRSFAP
jgi:hypothetical protein